MPQFTVPQFIEYEPKIVGPFTFKQFIYVGIAGAICFFLYFTLAKVSFFLFILISAIIISGALALAFLKSGGRSLPVVIKNFFVFSISPKIYLWKKKNTLPPKIIAEPIEMKEEREATTITIAGKSRLRDLSTHVETKVK
jgi:hypothetical protein